MAATKKETKDARTQSLEILLEVLPGAKPQKSLSQLLAPSSGKTDQNKHPAFSPFTQLLVYGVCRYYLPLSALIRKHLKKPLKPKDRDIHILLLIGAYQLLYTEKAQHAVIFETAEITKKRGKQWATGLVNAILRKISKEQPIDQTLDSSQAFPQWLKEKVAKAYSLDQRNHIYNNSLIPGPMTLRVNVIANTPEQFKRALEESGIAFLENKSIQECVTLLEPTAVHEIPGFYQGHCSVQDEAAQWAAILLASQTDAQVLDVCAAPGGKSCHLIEKNPTIKLTAVDISNQRLNQVSENLERLGHNAQLLCFDASLADNWRNKENSFHHILLDAPCSGTGVIRRHPDIFWLRRSSDIQALAELQQRLLEQTWKTLKPGGTLLYCTCSILPEENQGQIQHFLKNHPDAEMNPEPLSLLRESCITSNQVDHTEYGVQLLPTAQRHDGFYYALLKKLG